MRAEIASNLSQSDIEWTQKRFDEGLLVKSDLSKPEELVLKHQRESVAFHEEGHAGVALGVGGSVFFKTVIPEGNTLGLTKASPDNSKSQPDQILDAIAISAGGEQAEEMLGITDHRGCGSDRFKQRMLAHLYIRMTNSVQSVGSILDHQRSRARSILESVGLTAHKQRSFSLLRAGSIA